MTTLRTALAAALVSAAALASCSERKTEAPPREPPSPSSPAPQSQQGAVKISLVPPQGAPVELHLGWTPFPESEGWVEPMAALMHSALAECGTPSSATDLQLKLEDNALRVPPEDLRDAGACLYEFLGGKRFEAAGAQSRQLLVRLVPGGDSR